jgi:hypothetical protein
MATGAAFVPTPFTTTVVAPQTSTAFGHHPYISVSEFQQAPTAVGTRALVSGSTNQQQDSLRSLANVIERASAWADLIAFHRPDGSFAATSIVESMWVKPKGDGSMALTCNFKPVLEVTGLALGITPSLLTNVDSNTAKDLWIDGKVITIPGWWNLPASSGPVPFARTVGMWGKAYVVWSYICGYPLTTLSASVAKNDVTLTVNPSVPGGTTVAGVYAGTPLTINDGDSTETVVATAAPAGLTVATSAAQFAHTIPQSPDSIRVSALPRAIEQATILLTACLLKVRGSRAMSMPQTPGGMPGKSEMGFAGTLEDFEIAEKLLKRFVVATQH